MANSLLLHHMQSRMSEHDSTLGTIAQMVERMRTQGLYSEQTDSKLRDILLAITEARSDIIREHNSLR